MSTFRLFAQLDFERALGNAAIDALEQAMTAKAEIEAQSDLEQSGYDREATMAEVNQVIADRVRDVLTGPGLRNIERGERFRSPEIVALVMAARDNKWNGPG